MYRLLSLYEVIPNVIRRKERERIEEAEGQRKSQYLFDYQGWNIFSETFTIGMSSANPNPSLKKI